MMESHRPFYGYFNGIINNDGFPTAINELHEVYQSYLKFAMHATLVRVFLIS